MAISMIILMNLTSSTEKIMISAAISKWRNAAIAINVPSRIPSPPDAPGVMKPISQETI